MAEEGREVGLALGTQSQVSTAVARLREAGSIVTEVDPADRRRMLVRRAPELTPRRIEVAGATIDDALVRALGTDDPQALAEVLAALDVLGRRLTPATIRRLRTGAAGGPG
ncbi:hypothetical protein ACWGB8_21530 [Kitasatospora sp. NPDC054939]